MREHPYLPINRGVTKFSATNVETDGGTIGPRNVVYISACNPAGGAVAVTICPVTAGGSPSATNRFGVPVPSFTGPYLLSDLGDLDVYTQTNAGTCDVYIIGG